MISKRTKLVLYGALLSVGAIVVALRPDYFGNVAFLVIGALVGIYPAFLIEEIRKDEQIQRVREAVFFELANRVARCCFDFEDPWRAYAKKPDYVEPSRAQGFTPVPPIIYPALASQFALLGRDAQKVIEFYVYLEAWRRSIDIKVAAVNAVVGSRLTPTDAQQLAERLRRAVKFGGVALVSLSKGIPDAEQIMLDAIAEADKMFPERHPNKGKPLLDRIRLVLDE
jgi:hypothetical protein